MFMCMWICVGEYPWAANTNDRITGFALYPMRLIRKHRTHKVLTNKKKKKKEKDEKKKEK